MLPTFLYCDRSAVHVTASPQQNYVRSFLISRISLSYPDSIRSLLYWRRLWRLYTCAGKLDTLWLLILDSYRNWGNTSNWKKVINLWTLIRHVQKRRMSQVLTGENKTTKDGLKYRQQRHRSGRNTEAESGIQRDEDLSDSIIWPR